jgi:hypothetical protein
MPHNSRHVYFFNFYLYPNIPPIGLTSIKMIVYHIWFWVEKYSILVYNPGDAAAF